jgi:glycosyltransferase involved in cell wall biosynthesis
MDKPIVTVIIATFNSARTLEFSIESVLAQDFSDYEVWVVGDACTDHSQQVVESFADNRLHWTNLATNSGSQGAPNNEGIRRARGDYIAYLGHDDLWFPWHLSGLVAFIQKTKADLVHAISAAYGPSGLEYTVGPPSTGRSYGNHFVFPSCWLHPRCLTEDLGPWGDHRRLSRGVDMDFLRRVHLAGKPIMFYPRLGLLKFPSAWWGTYATDFQAPQARYLEAMKRDPLGLERETLAEVAILLARRTHPKVPVREALLQLFRSLVTRISDLCGRENRLLERFRLWHIQRLMRKQRRKRGLPPAPR